MPCAPGPRSAAGKQLGDEVLNLVVFDSHVLRGERESLVVRHLERRGCVEFNSEDKLRALLQLQFLFILYLGNAMPSVPEENMPPWQILQLAAPVALPNGEIVDTRIGLYQLIYATTSGAVFASMLASSGQVDMYTLQKLLTHKSPQMTQRYAHLRDEALRKASDLAGDLIAQALKEKDKVVTLKDQKE